jgi:WD40 repeat protein
LIAYTTEANQIVIADLSTGTCVGRPLVAHTHNVQAVAWSPTGRYLVSAGAIADGDSRHGVALWDREQISQFVRVIYEFNYSSVVDPKFALSADGSSWICGACDGRIIWDGRPVDLPPGDDPGPILEVAIKRDGKEAAFASVGGIVVVRRKADSFSADLRRRPLAPVHALVYVNGALYGAASLPWKLSADVESCRAAPFGRC